MKKKTLFTELDNDFTFKNLYFVFYSMKMKNCFSRAEGAPIIFFRRRSRRSLGRRKKCRRSRLFREFFLDASVVLLWVFLCAPCTMCKFLPSRAGLARPFPCIPCTRYAAWLRFASRVFSPICRIKQRHSGFGCWFICLLCCLLIVYFPGTWIWEQLWEFLHLWRW